MCSCVLCCAHVPHVGDTTARSLVESYMHVLSAQCWISYTLSNVTRTTNADVGMVGGAAVISYSLLTLQHTTTGPVHLVLGLLVIPYSLLTDLPPPPLYKLRQCTELLRSLRPL